MLIGLALSVTLSGVNNVKADQHTGAETLIVTPSEADFAPGTRNSRTSVWVYGSGFAPGSSLIVLIADSRGVATDVGALSGVDVVANDDGAFGFEWVFARFTRKGVGAEGMQSVRAVGADSFQDIASAPLALCNLTRNAKYDAYVMAMEEDSMAMEEDSMAMEEDSMAMEAPTPVEVPDFCSK